MSNEISNNITKYIKNNSANPVSAKHCADDSVQKMSNELSACDNSMDCLNAMGCAKVNMDGLKNNKNVTHAIQTFNADPDFAQNYNDFYDTLLERNYCAQEALRKTDAIFEILKDEKTYRD